MSEEFILPFTTIRGRTGTTGCFNATTGILRIDHTGDPGFWMEIDISSLREPN
jgi:hypothetical protein